MAIDPGISLQVQPPNINVPMPQPIQQLGQVLTLGNLIEQQQMGGLQLKMAQMDYQRQLALANVFADEFGGRNREPTLADARPAGAPPFAPAALTASVSGIPYATPQPAAPVSGIPYAAPQAAVPPAPPALAGFGPDLLTQGLVPPPPATPAAEPSAAAAPQPAPAAQAPEAVPQAVAQAPVMGLSPDFYRRIIQADPFKGPAIVEQMTKSIQGQYNVLHAQYTTQKDAADRESTILQGAIDEPSKNAAVMQLYQEGLISRPEYNHMMNLPVGDRYFKSRMDMAMDRSKYLENERADIEQAQKTEKFNWERANLWKPEARQKTAEAATADVTAEKNELDAAQRNLAPLTNISQIPAWLSQQGPRAQQRIFSGAMNLPQDATLDDYKNMVNGMMTAGPAALKGAETGAELTAKQKFYQGITKAVRAGTMIYQDLPPEIQKEVLPGLAEPSAPTTGGAPAAPGGAAPIPTAPGAGGGPAAAPAPYVLKGPRIKDDELERLTELNHAVNLLKDTQDYLTNGMVALPGPFGNISIRAFLGPGIPERNLFTGKPLPVVGDPIRTIDGNLGTTKQQLKALITNKSLRNFTPEAMDEIFPTSSKSGFVNDQNVAHLLKVVQMERDQYVKDLVASNKLLPSGAIPPEAASTPRPAAQPTNVIPWQSPIKITAGGQAPNGPTPAPTPPNRVRVRMPDGTIGTIPADQLERAKRAGYTEIP
jgi:hypothetical protein